MATVLKVEHLENGDVRALKLLHGDMANDEVRHHSPVRNSLERRRIVKARTEARAANAAGGSG